MLVLPEVERSQTEVDSGVWNMNRPVHDGDLLLLHRTRPVGLPANHKLTRGLVHAGRRDRRDMSAWRFRFQRHIQVKTSSVKKSLT